MLFPLYIKYISILQIDTRNHLVTKRFGSGLSFFHLHLPPISSYLTNPINSGPVTLGLFLKLKEYKQSNHIIILTNIIVITFTHTHTINVTFVERTWRRSHMWERYHRDHCLTGLCTEKITY